MINVWLLGGDHCAILAFLSVVFDVCIFTLDVFRMKMHILRILQKS
jgi:hypothetical protein